MTSQPTNNTNKVGFRARSFLLTLNEIEKYNDLKDTILKLKSCDYFLSSKELAPTTNHEHIHIYIHFESNYKLSKKILSFGAHVDICNYGSPKQVINYVKKDGDILDEIGEIPHQGLKTVEDLKQLDISEIPPQYYNIYKKVKEDEEKDIDIDDLKKNVQVFYIQGETGIGKTEKMKEIVRSLKNTYGSKINMVKYENGFYLGTGNAKICVYDDWRDNHMKASEFINFIDYNKHYMNIKGGSKLNNYELIIITSIQKLDSIYSSVRSEQKEQWMRRIKLINLYPENTQNDNLENDIDIEDL